MRYRLLLLLAALLAPSAAWSQASVYMCVQLSTGIDRCAPVSASNPLPVTGGGGGASSTFGAAFPATGTAIGFLDSTGAVMAAGNLDASGNLKVTSVGVAQGSPTSGQTGSLVMGAVLTSPPTYTTAQTSPLSLDTSGNLRVTPGGGDPCQTIAKTYTPINIGSATTTRIIAPAASKKTYICSIDLFAFSADNVAVVEGTGGTCGSGTAGVVGGTTTATGLSFPTQGGLAKGSGGFAVWATAGTNVDFCLITSTTGPLTGTVAWVQQ